MNCISRRKLGSWNREEEEGGEWREVRWNESPEEEEEEEERLGEEERFGEALEGLEEGESFGSLLCIH